MLPFYGLTWWKKPPTLDGRPLHADAGDLTRTAAVTRRVLPLRHPGPWRIWQNSSTTNLIKAFFFIFHSNSIWEVVKYHYEKHKTKTLGCRHVSVLLKIYHDSHHSILIKTDPCELCLFLIGEQSGEQLVPFCRPEYSVTQCPAPKSRFSLTESKQSLANL